MISMIYLPHLPELSQIFPDLPMIQSQGAAIDPPGFKTSIGMRWDTAAPRGWWGWFFASTLGIGPKKKNVVYQQFPQGTLQDSASLRLLSQIPIEVSQPESTWTKWTCGSVPNKRYEWWFTASFWWDHSAGSTVSFKCWKTWDGHIRVDHDRGLFR